MPLISSSSASEAGSDTLQMVTTAKAKKSAVQDSDDDSDAADAADAANADAVNDSDTSDDSFPKVLPKTKSTAPSATHSTSAKDTHKSSAPATTTVSAKATARADRVKAAAPDAKAATKPPGAKNKAAPPSAAASGSAASEKALRKPSTDSASAKRGSRPEASPEEGPRAKQAKRSAASTTATGGKRSAAAISDSGTDGNSKSIVPPPKKHVNVMQLPSCKAKPHELPAGGPAGAEDSSDDESPAVQNLITQDVGSPHQAKARRDPKRAEPLKRLHVPEAPNGPRRTRVLDVPLEPRQKRVSTASRTASARPAPAMARPAPRPASADAGAPARMDLFLKACEMKLYQALFEEQPAAQLLSWKDADDYFPVWGASIVSEVAAVAKQEFPRAAKWVFRFQSITVSGSLPPLLFFQGRDAARFEQSDLVVLSSRGTQAAGPSYIFGVVESCKRDELAITAANTSSHPRHLALKDLRPGQHLEIRILESLTTHLRRFTAAKHLGDAATSGNLLAQQIVQFGKGAALDAGRPNLKVTQILEKLRPPASQTRAIQYVFEWGGVRVGGVLGGQRGRQVTEAGGKRGERRGDRRASSVHGSRVSCPTSPHPNARRGEVQ